MIMLRHEKYEERHFWIQLRDCLLLNSINWMQGNLQMVNGLKFTKLLKNIAQLLQKIQTEYFVVGQATTSSPTGK